VLLRGVKVGDGRAEEFAMNRKRRRRRAARADTGLGNLIN